MNQFLTHNILGGKCWWNKSSTTGILKSPATSSLGAPKRSPKKDLLVSSISKHLVSQKQLAKIQVIFLPWKNGTENPTKERTDRLEKTHPFSGVNSLFVLGCVQNSVRSTSNRLQFFRNGPFFLQFGQVYFITCAALSTESCQFQESIFKCWIQV